MTRLELVRFRVVSGTDGHSDCYGEGKRLSVSVIVPDRSRAFRTDSKSSADRMKT